MAEEQGFEPWVPFGTAVFKTAAFNHSAIPPWLLLGHYRDFGRESNFFKKSKILTKKQNTI